jgi:hypothetical protein
MGPFFLYSKRGMDGLRYVKFNKVRSHVNKGHKIPLLLLVQRMRMIIIIMMAKYGEKENEHHRTYTTSQLIIFPSLPPQI